MRKILAIATAATLGFTVFTTSVSAASYTVRSGDSLWTIATANKISVEQLMRDNQLYSTMIYPGQILQINSKQQTYIVKSGDTFWTISQKFGVSLASLIHANPHIANPNIIWSGLVLNIPNTSISLPYAHGHFPLAQGTYQPYTNTYGDSRVWNPTGAAVRSHDGVDIFADKGTPIYSVLDGKIVNFGWNQYGGWRVTVRVDDSTVFYYAHLSNYASGLKMGADVKKGQLLGYVGNTGYGPEGTEGQFLPHLHFGIYKTNAPQWYTIDPYPYLQMWE